MTARRFWPAARERTRALASSIVQGTAAEGDASELASLVLAEFELVDVGDFLVNGFRTLSPEQRGELLDRLSTIHRHTSPGSLAREPDR